MPKKPKDVRSRKREETPSPVRGPPDTPPGLYIAGVGASAGGLDALTKFVAALPTDSGGAFILVQHLDPTHKSLMAALLTDHTTIPVSPATDGELVEPNHIYVIPAGSYLSVSKGALHLSKPTTPHGARMPVDFLLASMARDCGERAIAIILSGTGTDGTRGVKAVKASGGFVIVQDPTDAEYEGMPQNAVASGAADAVLSVAKIPLALIAHIRGSGRGVIAASPHVTHDVLPQVIEILRKSAAHDFSLYKMGTLQRRIERRMALASIPAIDMARYLALLEGDPAELSLLATDLLINVTSFFRDPNVFELLAKTTVPDIVRRHTEDRPLRIWIAGCSTGEEVYSLAMIFAEAIAAAKRTIKLCVFASDADPDAVATAREGYYPDTIVADVSPERLARFFEKQDHGYSVVPELRANVVFTVQDLLTDPPFSKLDLVSCRNLLIYLGPDAQAKVIALFHFALRQGGILLLGTSETIGHAESQFEIVAKSERIYRHIGKNRPGEFLFSTSSADGLRVPPRPDQGSANARQPALADLCRRLVLENYAPAVVLISGRYECLYSIGPTERYLRVATGYPTHDLLAMATPGMRTKWRATIDKVSPTTPHLIAAGGRTKHDGRSVSFDLDIRLVFHEGEELFLVGFVDRLGPTQTSGTPTPGGGGARVADLEHALDVARTDLSAAIHDLEISGEEHRAVNEEALSVNEEYQSANEELLTSKEELQSMNEELTALNGQLQETLERQRTTSNDLQNVLYSTDVATLFLDTELKIRFFTPATKVLFNLIPGDIGRPLADLRALSADPTLVEDAQAVLNGSKADDCEVEASGDAWFMRRTLPYRIDGDGVEGVVITFTDITERKATRKALEFAKREAERANLAKSRFLAAASHDLRQPLQSLVLLSGLLARAPNGEHTRSLIERLDQSLVTMSGMLNTLLDINQIEAGVVLAAPVDFVVGDLIERVREEFVDQADAQSLELRAVQSSRVIHSDPAMIEQMLRNLISNALKYTKHGKILLGCRQHGDLVRIEVWDTGIGIAATELDAIFDEYHQIDNAARERTLGLGLGLSIVQRLGEMLGHPVLVSSTPGKGSVFSIEIERKPRDTAARMPDPVPKRSLSKTRAVGIILVAEDDPDIRQLLGEFLRDLGHHVTTVSDGVAALAFVATGGIQPDLLLADFNLPGGMDGLALAAALRLQCHGRLPVIILTGDISTETLSAIGAQDCAHFNKPVDLGDLDERIDVMLAAGYPALVHTALKAAAPVIYVIDDDIQIRSAFRAVLEDEGMRVEDFADAEAFLNAPQPGVGSCLLIDAYLPHMSGLELLDVLGNSGHRLPVIMITGHSDVAIAVQAMKAGATDFIEKPVGRGELLDAIERSLNQFHDAGVVAARQDSAANVVTGLTKRQREVMDMVLAGHPNKNIAADLGISQRTVENHRATIMAKTGTRSLPELARLAFDACGCLRFERCPLHGLRNDTRGLN